jgi:glycosyltransferase involved in cell wall biosynthesis
MHNVNNKYIVSSFSIIYKSEKFLQGLIDNILEQTGFDRIEFVFLNPNSPDKSEDIIKPYLEKYNNFKLISLEQDPGLYECWNMCVKNSSAEYITNWNPDDRRSVDSIISLYQALSSFPQKDLAYGLTLITENENEKFESCKSNIYWPAYDDTFEKLYFHNSPHCMPIWRKSIHEKYGYFDNTYISAGDADMWLRAKLNGSQFLRLNKIVGSYFQSTETYSRNKNRLDKLIEEVYEMRCKFLKKVMRIE